MSSTGNTTVNNGYASSAQYPNKNILCLNCFHDIFFIPPTLIVLKPPFFVPRYIGEIMSCKRNKGSKLSGADFPCNTTQPNKVEVPAHWGNQKLYVSSVTHNLVFSGFAHHPALVEYRVLRTNHTRINWEKIKFNKYLCLTIANTCNRRWITIGVCNIGIFLI